MKNCILICVDCLRYDAFREILPLVPDLDALVATCGTTYASAYATAPWTYPSTNSMLTGLYPHRHGARHTGIYRFNAIEPWPKPLLRSIRTVFDDLGENEVRTVGISTIYWALNEKCNYRGCEWLIRSSGQDLSYRNVRAEWVFERFTRSCDEPRANGSFAYLHLSDLHRPYDLELAERNAIVPVSNDQGLEAWDSRSWAGDAARMAEFKRAKVELYRGLVRYTLQEIGKFLHYLRNHSGFGDTLVILTADHGEEFWDHEDEEVGCDLGVRTQNQWLIGTGHGHTLFNEAIHVPLVLISLNETGAAQLVEHPVSLVDVHPTILTYFGIAVPAGLDGRCLGEVVSDRALLVESPLYGFEKKALICGRRKLVYSPYDSYIVEYDLVRDPDELRPRHSVDDCKQMESLRRMFAKEIEGEPS